MRAATGGRAACPPLRFAPFQARPLAWRARASRVPGRRQQNSLATIDTLSMYCLLERPATRCTLAAVACHLTVSSRIAPLAITESAVRHGTQTH